MVTQFEHVITSFEKWRVHLILCCHGVYFNERGTSMSPFMLMADQSIIMNIFLD